MQAIIRRLVQFIFGVQAVSLLPVFPFIVYFVSTHGVKNPNVTPSNAYAVALLATALGVVYAAAWWTLKQGHRSMRTWGLVAGAIDLLLSVPILYLRYVSTASFVWLLPLAGIGSLYLFASPISRLETSPGKAKTPKPSRVGGDATSAVADVLVWLLASGSWLYGEIWCIRFLHQNDIWYPRGIALYGEYAVMMLLSIFVHEFGHAFGGWSVGMKLRMFAFGPFSWRINDGKWGFRFDSSQIFPNGGATGNVPRGPGHQVWESLLMIAAGPMINIGTGLIAVGFAVTLDPASPINFGGAMLMFGVISLIGGATNLLPFRVGQSYSDGAYILQLLNGGPAADIYFARAFVSSSLVTPLRPSDYDLELIERATLAATGPQRMLLLLYKYQHYLDSQEMPKAHEAFSRVESACESWQGSVPSALLLSMTFAAAFVKRDPVGARRYWEKMEASSKDQKSGPPIRKNVDYWIAQCALSWSEHDFDTANTAWQRGAVLANQLPSAGAYDFDRYKYLLMQSELEQRTARFDLTDMVAPKERPAWDSAY